MSFENEEKTAKTPKSYFWFEKIDWNFESSWSDTCKYFLLCIYVSYNTVKKWLGQVELSHTKWEPLIRLWGYGCIVMSEDTCKKKTLSYLT